MTIFAILYTAVKSFIPPKKKEKEASESKQTKSTCKSCVATGS